MINIIACKYQWENAQIIYNILSHRM